MKEMTGLSAIEATRPAADHRRWEYSSVGTPYLVHYIKKVVCLPPTDSNIENQEKVVTIQKNTDPIFRNSRFFPQNSKSAQNRQLNSFLRHLKSQPSYKLVSEI